MLCDTASLPVFQPHAMKRSCLLLQVCWRYTKISFSGLAALWWIQQLHHYVLYRTCTTSLSLLGSPTSIQFNLCYELFCWLIQVIWLHITSLHGSSCFGWNMLKHTNIRSITWFKFFINTTRIWFAKQKKNTRVLPQHTIGHHFLGAEPKRCLLGRDLWPPFRTLDRNLGWHKSPAVKLQNGDKLHQV